MAKPLIIFTHPPGAPAREYLREQFPDASIYMGEGKVDWKYHKGAKPAVLVTAAPKADAKSYWLEEARRSGFSPRLMVLLPTQAICVKNLTQGLKDDRQRARLKKRVQRWYNDYTRHDEEIRIDGRTSLSQTKVG